MMSDIAFQPHDKEEAFAHELADRLGDPDGLPFYIRVVQRYREAYIRDILGIVLQVPAERIRTSRGALFNWLLDHHELRPKGPDENLGD